MDLIKLDINNKAMCMKLLPIYQIYEAEISEDELDEFYPKDSFDALFEHFKQYFDKKTTIICEIEGVYQGFVTFHVVCEKIPAYAKGYEGWGHISEIFISQDARGLGLGKLMVEKAEKELNKLNVKGIHLMNLLPENKGFWESLGYKFTGKIEPNEGGHVFEKAGR